MLTCPDKIPTDFSAHKKGRRPFWSLLPLFLSLGLALWMLLSATVASARQTAQPGQQARAGEEARVAPASVTTIPPSLNISPKRLIFDPRSRVASVNVFNQGNAPISVDIALIDDVMLPSGEIVPLAEARRRGGDTAARAATVKSARSVILATPSRMTIAAGKGRTIRLQARPDATMLAASGEYRTHLTISTIPSPASGLTAENAAAAGASELSIQVQSIFGLSIPLILRTGRLEASVSLGTAELVDVPSRIDGDMVPALRVPVRRTGAKSVYGNVEVRSGVGEKAELIGAVRGLGVYGELGERMVDIPLERRARPGETLVISFIDDENGSGEVMARGQVTAR